MSLLDSLKNLMGVKPVNIGDLNQQATKKSTLIAPAKPPQKSSEEIEITEEYKTVKTLLEQDVPIVFVSGKAGTGKSTLIKYLLKILSKKTVIVAPTGVAALNVQGVTIHSFFRFPPRVIHSDDIQQVQDRRLYKKLELLIIDEISMVRADQIDGIDTFLRLNGSDSLKPFGGVQLLLVGDLFQLPPVVTSEEEIALKQYKSPYFFSAKALQDLHLVPVELSKIYRQTDSEFTDMLNKVRVAEDLEKVIPRINESCYNPNQQKETILTLTSTNASADQMNQAKLQALPGELITFTGETSGRFALKDTNLPSPLNLQLKVGARVMFTKNDEQKRWVNGTMGQVKEVTNRSIRVELLTDHLGKIYEVSKAEWESFIYEFDSILDRITHKSSGKYVQYPLMLAWAVTIHKGQGKTLENVRIDLGNRAFASGQVYVALSRCRTLKDITLARPINIQEVKCDDRIKSFYLALSELQKN